MSSASTSVDFPNSRPSVGSGKSSIQPTSSSEKDTTMGLEPLQQSETTPTEGNVLEEGTNWKRSAALWGATAFLTVYGLTRAFATDPSCQPGMTSVYFHPPIEVGSGTGNLLERRTSCIDSNGPAAHVSGDRSRAPGIVVVRGLFGDQSADRFGEHHTMAAILPHGQDLPFEWCAATNEDSTDCIPLKCHLMHTRSDATHISRIDLPPPRISGDESDRWGKSVARLPSDGERTATTTLIALLNGVIAPILSYTGTAEVRCTQDPNGEPRPLKNNMFS